MMYPNTSILDPDNGPTGFTTPDFQFAAIPFGKEYMIIADGQQLEVVKTRQLAEIRLEQLKNSHRTLKKGTKTPAPPKSQKKAKTSSGRKGSQGPKPKATKGSTKSPKSKSVTVKKPYTLHPNPLMDALL
jgi:hypothetical protein